MKGVISVSDAIEKIVSMIDSNPLFKTEYVEIVDAATLRPVTMWDEAPDLRLSCAVYAGPVRLIDNIAV